MTVNAQNNLSYLGVAAKNPPDVIKATRAPTTAMAGIDVNYPIGTIWIDTSAATCYMLVAIVANTPSWDQIGSGASDVAALIADSGGVVLPNAGVIGIIGGTNITTTGATPNITVDLDAIVTNLTSLAATTITTNVAAHQLSLNGTTVGVSGTDANIDLNLASKGTGVIGTARALVGGDIIFEVLNTDNTNVASNAIVFVETNGAGSGDPKTEYAVNGVTTWSTGIDNSVNDTYVISASAALGTSDAVQITKTGTMTLPSGDLFVERAAVGDVVGTIENTSVANLTDRAVVQVTSGGAAGGDALTSYTVTGGSTWSTGIDNSVSDSYVIAASGALGTSNVISAATAGTVSMPLQPAFLGYLAVTATDKTGNGTTYTLGTDALTEVYDQGSNFTTAGVFTAPIDGIYDLRAQVTITGATIATTFVISIVTTGRTYTKTFIKAAGAEDESVDISVLAQMAATNTATVTITVSGEAGDTDDILGSATAVTFFCGCLVV